MILIGFSFTLPLPPRPHQGFIIGQMVNTPPVVRGRPMCQFVLWIVNRRLYVARGVASKFSRPFSHSPLPSPHPSSSECRTNTAANEQVNMFAGGRKDSLEPPLFSRSLARKNSLWTRREGLCVVFVGVMAPPLGPLVMSVCGAFPQTRALGRGALQNSKCIYRLPYILLYLQFDIFLPV